MADMGGRFVKSTLAVVIFAALLPTAAKFIDTAANATGVTSTQADVIRLILTILVLAGAYAVYTNLVRT